MFGIVLRKKPFVHAHWFIPLASFRSDTAQCYQSLEEELTARKMPQLVVERIDFKDGGWLSPKRAYLRMRRERTVLDFCSAAFGTGWYFSCRAATLPRSLTSGEKALVLLGLAGFYALYWMLFGLVVSGIVFGASGIFLLVVFLSARKWGGLDEFLLYLPVIGAVYEARFRKESYQREDQRLVYVEMVLAVIRQKVVEFTAAGGVEDPEPIHVKLPNQILTQREMAKYFPEKLLFAE